VIRINLLTQKRAAPASTRELWLVAILSLCVVEIVACLVVYGMKQDELESQQRDNASIQSQVAKIKSVAKDHDEVKTKLTALRAREDAIAKLQSARSGPTAMLLEIARILTPGRGPSMDPDQLAKLRRENPLADYNPSWDARRLWLVSFVENEREVRLDGMARDGEDVSELARRMNLSSYFYDVRLLPAKRQREKVTGLEMVSFQLQAKVRY
jgi:type IV pilus assembly protein PilN